jgi:hypothetical protein
MIAQSIKGKLLVFAIFFTGIATGFLVSNFYETRVSGGRQFGPDRATRVERARREVDRVHEYLGLTEEQRQQVSQILEDTRARFRELQKQTRPQFDAIQEESHNKIRAILSEEQLAKYNEFLEARAGRQRRRD